MKIKLDLDLPENPIVTIVATTGIIGFLIVLALLESHVITLEHFTDYLLSSSK